MAKKVSVKTIEKVMKNTYCPTTTVRWNDIDITVTNTISLVDMMQLVADVVSGCFESGSGQYTPEVEDFLLRSSVVEKYSNVSLPDDVAKRYDVLYKTDIYPSIVDAINPAQYLEIGSAIKKKVDAIIRSNADLINEKVSTLESFILDLKAKAEGAFSLINAEDVALIRNAIKDGEFSAESFAKAYISAKKDQ